MGKDDECIGCRNIREQNWPVWGYSEVRKCYIMNVNECWTDEKGKAMRQVDIRYCPVCGNKLEK